MSQEKHKLEFIVLGDVGSGRRRLITRFCKGEYDPNAHHDYNYPDSCINKTKTIEIDRREVKISCSTRLSGEEKLEIGGGQNPIRNVDALVFVYDPTGNESIDFESIRYRINDVYRHLGREVPTILVRTKSDISAPLMNIKGGQQLAEELNILYDETSAKAGKGVEKVFYDLAKKVLVEKCIIPEPRLKQEDKQPKALVAESSEVKQALSPEEIKLFGPIKAEYESFTNKGGLLKEGKLLALYEKIVQLPGQMGEEKLEVFEKYLAVAFNQLFIQDAKSLKDYWLKRIGQLKDAYQKTDSPEQKKHIEEKLKRLQTTIAGVVNGSFVKEGWFGKKSYVGLEDADKSGFLAHTKGIFDFLEKHKDKQQSLGNPPKVGVSLIPPVFPRKEPELENKSDQSQSPSEEIKHERQPNAAPKASEPYQEEESKSAQLELVPSSRTSPIISLKSAPVPKSDLPPKVDVPLTQLVSPQLEGELEGKPDRPGPGSQNIPPSKNDAKLREGRQQPDAAPKANEPRQGESKLAQPGRPSSVSSSSSWFGKTEVEAKPEAKNKEATKVEFWMCSLTLERMEIPYVGEDGRNYDRKNLIKFKKVEVDKEGEIIGDDFRPNPSLKAAIDQLEKMGFKFEAEQQAAAVVKS